MSEHDPTSPPVPPQQVVIRQGGSGTGIGLVIAALILGGASIYVVNIWSSTQQKLIETPGKVIQKGIESVKEAAKDLKAGGGN